MALSRLRHKEATFSSPGHLALHRKVENGNVCLWQGMQGVRKEKKKVCIILVIVNQTNNLFEDFLFYVSCSE